MVRTLARSVGDDVNDFIARRRRWLGGLLIIGAVVAFYIQGTNLSNAGAKLTALQHQLAGTVSASANTRITTVTQRCRLTYLDSRLAAAVHKSELQAQYVTSWRGCEKQLKKVKKIAKSAQ